MPWNDFRWTLYAPIYDPLLTWLTAGSRRDSLGSLRLASGQKVLIVACGTGLDFNYLPKGIDLHALDRSPAMLTRARNAARRAGNSHETIIQGDAAALPYHDGQFDAVVLHFILAVADRPELILSEARRVLKPGGQLAALDKGVREGQKPGLLRRLLNPTARPLATDITLDLVSLVLQAGFQVEEIAHTLHGVFYRIRARHMG